MSKRFTSPLVIILVVIIIAKFQLMAQGTTPIAAKYTPHIFTRADLELFRIQRIDTEIWRDGRKSGIALREFSGLPDYCWAIKYTFVWNDETPSPGHVQGTPDPEPLIIFITDGGTVIGAQSRVHGQWLPINSSLSPFDFVNNTHIIVGFAPNVHTPAAGLIPALITLSVGNFPSDLASAVRYLEHMVQKGIIYDGGH